MENKIAIQRQTPKKDFCAHKTKCAAVHHMHRAQYRQVGLPVTVSCVPEALIVSLMLNETCPVSLVDMPQKNMAGLRYVGGRVSYSSNAGESSAFW